uniref:Uncharacterized protein n=1 Tax=Oryza glumipatula TaxID=40148 RepID=A0A0E0AT37_9ORYZ
MALPSQEAVDYALAAAPPMPKWIPKGPPPVAADSADQATSTAAPAADQAHADAADQAPAGAAAGGDQAPAGAAADQAPVGAAAGGDQAPAGAGDQAPAQVAMQVDDSPGLLQGARVLHPQYMQNGHFTRGNSLTCESRRTREEEAREKEEAEDIVAANELPPLRVCQRDHADFKRSPPLTKTILAAAVQLQCQIRRYCLRMEPNRVDKRR